MNLISIRNNLIHIKTEKIQEIIDYIKTFPIRKWNGITWECPISYQSLDIIIQFAIKFNIPITQEIKDTIQSILKNSPYKNNPKWNDLYPFQKYAVEKLYNNKTFALFDEMGLGKTISTSISIPINKPVLCIVPASLKYNWEIELKIWSMYNNITILNGRNSFCLPENNEIIIVNFDILPTMDTLKELKFTNDLIVIIDELHYCKGRKSLRTEKVEYIANKADITWGLTGSPLINKPVELWQSLQTINLATKTFFHFGLLKRIYNATKEYIKKKDKNGNIKTIIITNWGKPEPETHQRLSHTTLRRERTDVLPELPTKTHMTVKVDIKKAMRKKLDKIEKEWDLWIEKQTNRKIIECKDKLPPIEMLSNVRKELAILKIPTMIDLVKQHIENNKKVIVFSWHTEPIKQLKEQLGIDIIIGDTNLLERQKIVERFQNGKSMVIGGTIGAMGVGWTLTAGHHTIFVDLAYTPDGNRQCEDRSCRIGQNDKCVYITIIANHIIDRRCQELLQEKDIYVNSVRESRDTNNVISLIELVNKCKIENEIIKEKEIIPQLPQIPQNNFKPAIYTLYKIDEEMDTTKIDRSKPTKNHRTYRIFKQPKGEWLEGKIMISLFTGDDNTRLSNYTKIAFYNNGKINLWNKFKDTLYSQWVDILENMINGTEINNFKLVEARICYICKKLLTTPESIAKGIGPDCESKQK